MGSNLLPTIAIGWLASQWLANSVKTNGCPSDQWLAIASQPLANRLPMASQQLSNGYPIQWFLNFTWAYLFSIYMWNAHNLYEIDSCCPNISANDLNICFIVLIMHIIRNLYSHANTLWSNWPNFMNPKHALQTIQQTTSKWKNHHNDLSNRERAKFYKLVRSGSK